jgi:phosphoribosyl 1,2-cyclic phosphate phosphodiesterase
MTQVTFLGTGTSQGVPVIACGCKVCKSMHPHDKRLRSSIMIKHKGKTVVVDTGPDFRQQMLRENVNTLDAVIFTHEHKDHVAGLDDVRAFNFMSKEAMDIYATEKVQNALKNEFHYAFSEEKYPGTPVLNLIKIENKKFTAAGIEFEPIEVMHYKLPVFGFRFNDFTYVTDAKTISYVEKEKMKGTRFLVLNALRRSEHISHFNLEQALELIREIKPERAFLTHISHLMGEHAEVEQILPDNVQIAHDGLKIEF